MWEAKLEPDAVSYTAGISACETSGQRQRSRLLFSEMREKVELGVICDVAGINACENNEQWQQGLSAERDVGREGGVRRRELRHWDQRVREVRAVVAGSVAAERDAGGEGGTRRRGLRR